MGKTVEGQVNMQSKQIKRFGVVFLSMVAIMLSWAVFWPTHLSLPVQHIFPSKPPDTLFMFFLCNFIIFALIRLPQLGFFTNSNSVTADNIIHEEYGGLPYCQQRVLFSDETAGQQETPNSEYGESTEEMKFICSADDASANAGYRPKKSEKKRRGDIIKYTENCEVENCDVSLGELMQLVEVPEVIDIKKYNELASLVDEDFNRTVEEFIAKFKRELGLQRQQSMSRRGLRL